MTTAPHGACDSDLAASSLVGVLRSKAQSCPDRQAYTFLAGDEASGLTYAQLDTRARAVAACLQGLVKAGERALLFYLPGLDYATAFFGCLYAEIIAVPAYPPRLNRSLERLRAIAEDAQARVALTTSAILARLPQLVERAPELKRLRWLSIQDLPDEAASEWRQPEIKSDALAYLQYTSGSTASPRGVMISHRNVLENCADINRGFERTAESISLSWLPHFHDMGLIEGIIQPVYVGMPGLLMSPTVFLQRPLLWLQAISHYRVTHSGGPNFAYDLCVRKIGPVERSRLDLSSWRVAYNGAEPIRQETLETFAERFNACGFRARAFYPAYGLAEATLKVSGGSPARGAVYCSVQADALEGHRVIQSAGGQSEQTRVLVGSGRAALGTEIAIVAPEQRTRCAADEVGEIWVKGPGVALGYWNRPDETERTFGARLRETGEGPFLRTGDLGFLKDGELFVTGRTKDLIIIRGRNHYPQDIEQTVELAHAALRPNCSTAFSVKGPEERLVIVQELEPRREAEADAAIEAVRRAVAEGHEVEAHAIALVRAGSIPKTSSGKLQRSACRALFLAHRLEVIAEWCERDLSEGERFNRRSAVSLDSREAIQAWLAHAVAATLRIAADEIADDRPLTDYGLDSLVAVELMHRIETGLGLSLPMASILENPSLSEIASQAMKRSVSGTPRPSPELAPAKEMVTEHALSWGQQALWFLHQAAPHSAAYHIASALSIRAELDLEAWRRALQAVVNRHSCLRSTFTSVLGAPSQLIHSTMEVALRIEDARGWSEAQLNAWLVKRANQPFDLECGPLMRADLLMRRTDENILLLVVHHLVADFWSLAVFMKELGALYESEKHAAAADLPPLAWQYSDYVRWQTGLLESAEGERLFNYWKEQLGGELPALELPTDRPRPAVQTFCGSSIAFRFDADLTAKLRALSRRCGATLYMTLLAAFQTLLHRYSRQQEIRVGSPTTGRGRAGFSGLVGYLVNPIVLRASFAGDPRFEQFLKRTREVVLEAFAHQDYPFALLVKRLEAERDPSRTPLFQAMFDFQKSPLPDQPSLALLAHQQAGAKLRFGSLELESRDLERGVAQFDLTLAMAESGDELAASFEYNTDLFDAATINRLAGHFQTLVGALASEPATRISDLALMSREEQRQLLSEWNSTSRERREGRCIHHIFEMQAESAPDRVAVEFGAQHLTYGQLNEHANRLANHLRRLGVGTDMRVALFFERSVEMLIGLLAVLKAGAGYVPIDTQLPAERLAFLLDDSQAAALLTERRLVNRLPEHRTKVICLESHSPLLERESGANPEAGATAENLAYVIYTSGSTGKPKGVMIEHRSLVNYIEAVSERYHFTAGDRILQFASISFDVSAEEIFGCLSRGATLVLRTDSMMTSADSLIGECRDRQITVLNLPTAYWHELVADTNGADWQSLDRLRLVIIGGERASSQRLREWQAMAPSHVRLANEYGPTEATVCTTLWELPEEPQPQSELREVPIGRPLTGLRAYVLGDHLQPTPIGVIGELYIGGEGVARGYLARPDLTAEKFIADPYGAVAGARLYKTGDLARHTAAGDLEFVGRADQQVKLRGFRIELGEIESALMEHPQVSDVVAAAREARSGARQLVAYVVGRQGGLIAEEIQRFARHKLPAYLVPSAFVIMDALPLTANGKIDYRALPEPAESRTQWDGLFPLIQSPAEQQLAKIWSDILKLERVAPHENFFELGGDSILSLQLIARARAAGLELTPRQVFEHPTLAELARVAGDRAGERPERGLVVGELPLTPIQQWFFEQRQPALHHWNMAVLVEARRPLQPALVGKAIGQLLEHHDALRLRFIETSSGWRPFIASPDEALPFQVIDLSHLPKSERGHALRQSADQTQASLDLAAGPLLRAVLFEMGEGEPSQMLVVIHHLAVDAVSWPVLLQDFETAYGHLERGGRAELPAKTTSFKRWAEVLEQHTHSSVPEREASYWFSVFDNPPPPLPMDFPGGENLEASARTVSVSLNQQQTHALLRIVPEVYHTEINDVLLTALAEAFARWTGSRSLLVEFESHGREEITEGIDLSRTVGWITSTFPVKLTLEADFEPGEALKSVKEQRRRIPRRGIGYGLLRYKDAKMADEMRLQVAPAVSFNYLGQLDQSFASLSLLRVSGQPAGQTRSRHARRSHLIEINGGVSGGRLQLEWAYSQKIHRRETIAHLAQGFLDALSLIIDHCRSADAGGYTPSDFPLARLDQKTLDRLTAGHPQIEDIYPLSPAQHGMLFHTLYAPHSSVYTGQLSLRLEGRLDHLSLERAWQEVVARHAALRSTFVWDDLDEPLQIVHQRAPLALVKEDWRGLTAAEQGERFERFLEADQRSAFDLATSPPMRLALIRVDDERHQFIWTHHHLLLDGWSLSLVLAEVFRLYESFRQGVPLRLERSRPYSNYIEWLSGQDLQQAESFWRALLKGFTAPTALPPTPAVRAADGGSGAIRLELRPSVAARLHALAKARRLTLGALFQSAWSVLLWRYSGETDVVFGSTVSGRPPHLAGVETMIGLFINTLPMRLAVRGGESLPDLAAAIHNRQSEIGQFEYSPLVKIREWCEVPRGSALFESIVVFENYPLDVAELRRGLSFEIGEARSFEKTNYPLTLVVIPGPRLFLELLYDPGRFDADTAKRMLGHLEALLEEAAGNPERWVATLSLLSERERHQLLHEFNDTDSDYPAGLSIPELFTRQVADAPERVALVFEDELLSYGELNARANRLAHYLRAQGVGLESRVGLCMGRSAEMVIAMLAILKAGGAYVPLDPSYPIARLNLMLEDARLPVVLTQERSLDRLAHYDGQAICLDTQWGAIATASPDDPPTLAGGDALAYVMYTSGSTGVPKGVAVTHHAISRLVINTNYVQLEPSDRVAQVANSSFDAATFEVWGALLNGAQLVFFNKDDMLSPVGFAEQMASRRISVLFLTTALFNEIARQAPSAFRSVRHLLVGGEAVEPKWVKRVLTSGPPGRLLNAYGPTESTTFAAWHLVESVDDHARSIPIGKPLSNTRAYVLDRSLNLVPVGIPGELYLGGDGLARGYWNCPNLTAERFIPEPFSGDVGTRLYRTGDLVRRAADGSLEFLGRNDHQVKVRGFRIELGEIESTLRRMEGVRDAVVLIEMGEQGDKRLTAYLACDEAHRPSAGQTRRLLAEGLPDYMVPSAFVLLDDLPLTPNGKTDRKALAKMSPTQVDPPSSYTAPQTEVEDAVAAIWAELLGVERVDTHDNFFELGGHSLLATRVISAVRQVFKIDLPLRDLFEAPTLCKFARAIIANEPKPGQAEKIARILKRIQSMTDEERARILEAKRREKVGV